MTRWTCRLDGTGLPDRALVGGKGWSIARMLALGLPVPPAFVVTTAACNAFLASGDLPPGLADEVADGVRWLEERTGRRFAAGPRRLLCSVRSGAAVSMPGMMDTVLNLGIDEEGEAALAAETGEPGFARDTLRRFHELYAAIVLATPVGDLPPAADTIAWRAAIARASGRHMPADPRAQLLDAIRAVFGSWNTRRARRYREHHAIPHDLGTAVTVQAMVFGNLDERSGTGVLFSRNPLTGERAPFGEYLPRAQGEDVVSGRFTPLALDAMRVQAADAHDRLLAAADQLEREQRDVQDIEFTVQAGELFLLQARAAKRAPEAAVRIAVEMVDEGLIPPDAALARVSAEQAAAVLLPRLAAGTAASATVVATGEGACPGIATGVGVGDPDEAERRAQAGEAVILVRETTSPDDIHGMIAARGIVTAQGGATSHAAVVSRALGRPCVVGVGEGAAMLVGRSVTVDGTGQVYAGRLAVEARDETADPLLARLTEWARAHSPVAVVDRAPADAVDLDRVADATDPAELARALAGHAAARGRLLATPDGARAAFRAGVQVIATTPKLPALLAIAALAREEGR